MTLKEEAEQLAKDRPTSLSDDLYQWAMDAEEMLWKLSAQAAQPAPRRLTEAEITLLVEAYYEDFGSAPPDLIRQVEGLIFGDAQPAQPGLPDCWVVLENGEIIGTHDAPVHIKGNAAIRYVPAQPAQHPDEFRCPYCFDKQPAQNEWKEAVIEQLAAHSMDAPVSDSPTVILAKIIHMAVLQATDPAIKVAQPAQVPEVEPVAWVLFRKDEDGLEPIQFYGGKDKPEGEFKDRFELRSVHLAPPDTEAGNMVQQPAQMPDYREIADCVLAGLEDRNGVLNLDVDADIEEEIRQEVADNIRMMLAAAPSTKEGQP